MQDFAYIERHPTWNDKYLDYEIETLRLTRGASKNRHAWNDKYLDYEIETFPLSSITLTMLLSLKRQVPRLRDWNEYATTPAINFRFLKRQVPRLRDWNLYGLDAEVETYWEAWNDKYLDYEIETLCSYRYLLQCRCYHLKRQVPRLRDWNWITVVVPRCVTRSPWNDKYLDYEIETG